MIASTRTSILLEEFRDGAAFRETDEGIDHPTLIADLLSGQYDQVLHVVAFNPAEGWSRDASELERRISYEGREIHDGLIKFIETSLGAVRRAAGSASDER